MRLFNRPTSPDPSQLAGVVRRTLDRARRGEGTVRKLSEGSIQIHVANQKVNIWEPVNGPVESAPHNHTQGFTSTVLYGRIRNERLVLANDPEGDYELYTMEHVDERRRMLFTNTTQRVRIARVITEDLRRGLTYHCPPEEFHVARQPELTMTFLQLWGEAETAQYSLLPYGTRIGTVERYMPTDELTATWATVERVCRLAGL